MARGHGKISTGFYQDPNVRALSEDARWLLQYLCTSPHSTAAGCYVLPIAYAAEDLQWPVERVSRGFVELSKKPFVRRDPATNMVCLPGWWDENPAESKNVGIHIVKLLKALPDCPVKVCAINRMLECSEHHPDAIEKFKTAFAKGIETPLEPLRTPEPEPEPELPPSEGAVAPLKDRIFGPCLAWLANRSGMPAKKLRSVVGKWCSQAGDGATLEAMTEAERNCPVGDPVAYIEATLNRKKNHAKPTADETFDAHVAGLANALGVGKMAASEPRPGDKGRTIEGDYSVVRADETGVGPSVRPGDESPDRVCVGVSDSVPKTGNPASNLPRAARQTAWGLADAGNRPGESSMDLANPDAIPGGYSEQGERGMEQASHVAEPRESRCHEGDRALSAATDRPGQGGEAYQGDDPADQRGPLPAFLDRRPRRNVA